MNPKQSPRTRIRNAPSPASPTAGVAHNFQSPHSSDNEKLVIEATVKLGQDAVQLQETRNKADPINEMDLTRARTELANVESELQAVTRRAEVEQFSRGCADNRLPTSL